MDALHKQKSAHFKKTLDVSTGANAALRKMIPPVQVRIMQMFCSGWVPTVSECIL